MRPESLVGIKKGAFMKKKWVGTIVVVAGICILTACTSLKVHSWVEPAFDGTAIQKAVVIGVAKSETIRRSYEDTFVSELTEAGVVAVASYTLIPQTGKLDKDVVVAAVKEVGADSVIVTRSVGVQSKIVYRSSRNYANYSRGYYGYYDWGFDQVRLPESAQTYVETKLETELYDVKSQQLLWTGQCEVTDFSSSEQNIKGVVAGIVKDFQKKGVVSSLKKN
jgi:hypothetical protein